LPNSCHFQNEQREESDRTQVKSALSLDEPSLVPWCFVLNPHRCSPYPNSQLELRDQLRVSSPATYIGSRLLHPAACDHFVVIGGSGRETGERDKRERQEREREVYQGRRWLSFQPLSRTTLAPPPQPRGVRLFGLLTKPSTCKGMESCVRTERQREKSFY